MATFYQVRLSDIQFVSENDLSKAKLNSLLNGYDSFEDQINKCSDSNAVALSGNKPYVIINGRHRVYLARKKNWSTIRARFV